MSIKLKLTEILSLAPLRKWKARDMGQLHVWVDTDTLSELRSHCNKNEIVMGQWIEECIKISLR